MKFQILETENVSFKSFNIAQMVSKSYQHFNQGRNKSNYCVVVCEIKKQKETNKMKREDTGRC
jgi:hypothetical protein